MRISIDGQKELVAALSNMSDEVERRVNDAVMETAANIEAEVKIRISQGPATGRLYTRGGVAHQASAPGEAPMSDTGTLVGSVYHQKEGNLRATAGSRLSYAVYLEYGTTKMAPRPVWEPVTDEQRPMFYQRVADAVGVAIR